MQNLRFVITGAPGGGKSTLIEYLRTLGYPCIDEPARKILADQRAIGGQGIPGINNRLFVDLMLEKMKDDYSRFDPDEMPLFFDRGIPDTIGYAHHFGFEYPTGHMAATMYRYTELVFFAPAWPDIYVTDDERKMTLESTCDFGVDLQRVYLDAGYQLICLPFASVEDRAQFILETIPSIPNRSAVSNVKEKSA